jgi:hypothetical protein
MKLVQVAKKCAGWDCPGSKPGSPTGFAVMHLGSHLIHEELEAAATHEQDGSNAVKGESY